MRKMLMTMLALLTLALPAVAQQPTIQPIPAPTTGVFGATKDACGFDVFAVPQAGRPWNLRLIEFQNAGIISAGPTFFTITNLSTGKSIDLFFGGPAQLISISPTELLVDAKGPTLFGFPPPPATVTQAAGLPAVPILYGRVVLTQDTNGNVLSIQSFVGHADDLCQLLR